MSRDRLWLMGLLGLAVLLVLAIPSMAVASKGVVDSFGQLGTGAGEFRFSTGVAVNQSTGDVYVADADCCGLGEGNRVEQFTADGAFVRAWGWGVATGAAQFEVCSSSCLVGLQGSGDGQFALALGDFDSTSPQVAVDQADGSVYVADNINNRVQKFSASGDFLDKFGIVGSGPGELSGPLGVAIDPVSGDVYVADTNNHRVQRFNSDGEVQSEFGSFGFDPGSLAGPMRLATDSTGDVYTVERDNPRVQRFNGDGSFERVFAEGAINSATDVAVDPADDHVYVAGLNTDLTVTGILEFAADGTGIDIHVPNAGLTVGGLAVRSSTGRLYASVPFSSAVRILDEVVAPTVSIDPVTDFDARSATFNGRVNPQGPPNTNYRFEYSADGGATWACVPDPSCVPASAVSVGDGTADVAVSQTVTGLDPTTEYRVRLVANKDFGAARATSSEEAFATDAAPPLVRAVAAGSRSDTAAWLGGEVNPQKSQTSYYVEYTLVSDTAYADSTRVPADSVDVGDGLDDVTVRQLVTGLQSDTAYRFRVVASNQAGTTNGSDRTFITRAPLPGPPVGRGYEMVSPLDKNGADIERNIVDRNQASSGAAVSGDAVAFGALGHFAGIGSGAPLGQYRSVRGPQGWTTKGINPPMLPEPIQLTSLQYIPFISEDLSHAVVGTPYPLASDASLLGGREGLYLQDISGPALSYDLLSAPFGQLPQGDAAEIVFGFAAATPDMRHVVFESEGVGLTPGAPSGSGTRGVYEWADGEVRFVSELPSGAPATLALAGANRGGLGQFHVGDHLVSDDGERIYFQERPTAVDPAGPLYVREGGSVTRPVSASQRTCDPPSPCDDPSLALPANFRAARASDGRLALFTSSEQLTDDATAPGGFRPCDVSSCRNDLYLWDANAPEGERLTDLTTADPDGGGVLNVARAADDLSHVYFVAVGDLAQGASAGRPNLYAWTPADGVRHVAVLDGHLDVHLWGDARNARAADGFRDARVSGDGSRLVFASHAVPTATDTAGAKQVYLYDYDEDRLVCVSCPGGGSSPSSDSWLFFPTNLGPAPYIQEPQMPYRLPRNISADGERVFFETRQGLVAGDINGKADVYLWEDGELSLNGELSLISTGKSGEKSEFIDASASGDDVFFLTRQRLVGADIDNQVDIYDARVGGGFPEAELPPECLGDPCQGENTSPPVLPGAGSTEGTGDARPTRPSLALRRLSARQRRALASGRRATLVVRVNTHGRVSVRGAARLDGRKRIVVRAGTTARRAGAVRLEFRLSKPARRALVRSKRLRVTFEVRFASVLEQRTVTLSSSRKGRR